VWWQTIGVVKYRGYRKVFTSHGTINNDLQALHRGKDINRAPVSSGAIVIKY
jgi:hypothetical protein